MLARHKSDSATTETKAGTSLATFENRRDSECDSQKVTGVNGETKKKHTRTRTSKESCRYPTKNSK